MNIAKKSISYVKESLTELKKVVWPTKQETIKHTILVLSISGGVAIFLGLIDYVFTMSIEKIIIQ